MNIQPTRMELSKLKKRLRTSTEAHKLLKDKQDELMRKFISLLRETRDLRKRINESIEIYSTQAGLSIAGFPYQMAQNLFLVKETLISADILKRSWMGCTVVDISYDVREAKPSSALISTPLLSKTAYDMRQLLPFLLQLTVSEKNSQILAEEIKYLRRRVNALEHMVIPDLKQKIRIIRMKLSDGERDTITRLIKVKSMK
ncbi:MAG: V-type ATP synthase subunit D [Oscillospiraceae bacterium]|nr:V-type ATP synthase subunit D [Oscillospiraceae bacterium]